MDAKGHIASSLQNVYTKATVPILAANNASSYTLDVTTTDGNPVLCFLRGINENIINSNKSV